MKMIRTRFAIGWRAAVLATGMPLDVFLLKGLADGSAEAYEIAYDRYSAALYSTALRMLSCQADAEDATQEVFTALVCSRATLGGVKNLKAYLFAALRNSVIRIMLKRKRNKTVALDDNILTDDNEYCENCGEAELLWRSCSKLPASQREVLALKIQGELSFREIAQVCGISANTAASRYRYALEKLRQILEIRK